MTFVKGVSGNPSGRPTVDPKIKEAFAKLLPRAIEVLRELLESEDEEVRIKAANSVLDRNLGKPAQAVAVTGENGGPLIAVIREK